MLNSLQQRWLVRVCDDLRELHVAALGLVGSNATSRAQVAGHLVADTQVSALGAEVLVATRVNEYVISTHESSTLGLCVAYSLHRAVAAHAAGDRGVSIRAAHADVGAEASDAHGAHDRSDLAAGSREGLATTIGPLPSRNDDLHQHWRECARDDGNVMMP